MSEKVVIVFGDKGSGKSSVINLLDRNVRKVQLPQMGQGDLSYSKFVGDRYTFYEIQAFAKQSEASKCQKFTNYKNLELILQNGVHLLVFVVKKGRIQAGIEQNYNLIQKQLCLRKVKTVMILTGCEDEEELGSWYRQNQQEFKKTYGFRFADVVSACCVNGDNLNMNPTFAEITRECYSKTVETLGSYVAEQAVGDKVWNSRSDHCDIVLNGFFSIFCGCGLKSPRQTNRTPLLQNENI